MERDHDPVTDLRRPAVIPDSRSGSIDLGSWNAASTPFPATMVYTTCCHFLVDVIHMLLIFGMTTGTGFLSRLGCVLNVGWRAKTFRLYNMCDWLHLLVLIWTAR